MQVTGVSCNYIFSWRYATVISWLFSEFFSYITPNCYLGESPSSSASDIDNLNNGLSKVASSSKDANSPQVAGNHLLLAVRNQPHLTRLLAYTNDVNCAFEATRKSQMAFASAGGNHERGTDSLSSIRTVLDFNFRSVNDLLRLVRLAMESISC